MKLLQIDIANACKICLSTKENMTPICETRVADMLLECFSIQLPTENLLPNLVCNECEDQIKQLFSFKQKVLKSLDIGQWLSEQKWENADINLKENSETEFVGLTVNETKAKLLDIEEIKIEYHDWNHPVTNEEIIDIQHDIANASAGDHTYTILDPLAAGANVNETTEHQQDVNLLLNDTKLSKLKSVKVINCDICKEKFRSQAAIGTHLKEKHGVAKPYVCIICDKCFSMKQLLTFHMKKHIKNSRHKCRFCKKVYYNATELKYHMRTHTGERPFSCDVCHRSFISKARMDTHKKRIHISDEEKHKHRCDLCDARFTSRSTLTVHQHRHAGIRPFSCSDCDKSFFRKDELEKHFSSRHDLNTTYPCTICSIVCNSKRTLNGHMDLKHADVARGPKAVQCLECKKWCSSDSQLAIHMRKHTGDRPYVCDQCPKAFPKSFTKKSHLSTHKKRVHQKFNCQHCGKVFGNQSSVNLHLKFHNSTVKTKSISKKVEKE